MAVILVSLLALVLSLDSSVGVAAPLEGDPPGGAYHLFRPVPRSAMREMSTDRPDRTESAYTLDAGHLQLEMDALAYTRDRTQGARFDGVRVATSNLKFGLTPRTDFQLVLETWNRERFAAHGTERVENSGFGDISTRLKVNLWGNDGGRTAFAVMPFMTLPTGQNDLGVGRTEGGIILPLAIELPREWGLGLMAQMNLHHPSAAEYHAEWIGSATASHDVVGNLSGFVELFGAWPTERGAEWTGTFDGGLTYAISPNFVVDSGFYAGLSEATENLTLFLGISLRR